MVIFSVTEEFNLVAGAYGFHGRIYIRLRGRRPERIMTHLLFQTKVLGPLSLAYIPRTLQPPTNLGDSNKRADGTTSGTFNKRSKEHEMARELPIDWLISSVNVIH
jgi:hypothetical protein